MNVEKDDLNDWSSFWKDQNKPLHRYDSEFFYELYAQELNLIFRRFGYSGGKVLESGCGNGALLRYMHIDKSQYTGMDISPGLIAEFMRLHPDVKSPIEDSAENIPAGSYDLIFSNGVGQYFNPARMQAYIRNAYDSLAVGGILVIANLLSINCRLGFGRGVYRDPAVINEVTLRQRVRNFLSILRGRKTFGPDKLGHWYLPEALLEMPPAGADGFLLGSLFHAYRFSVVFVKPKVTTQNG